ncbi:MAG: exonuclease domain-containing protein [Hyphomicrobiales bacterium]
MPRLKKNRTFWWVVLACIFFFILVALGLTLLLWQQLSMTERESILELIRGHSIYIFGAFVLLFIGIGFAVDWVYWFYILPIHQIAEETGIIYGVNPGHRIHLKGSREAMSLVGVINQAAEKFEKLHDSVEERIGEARARIEEEKKILSVVLAELPEGVLICSSEGLITLYNERARQLLEAPGDEAGDLQASPAGGFIGLGRSVFGVIGKAFIAHALDDIADKLRAGQQDLSSFFRMIGRNQRLLQVVTVPILRPMREISGFVLILTDVTAPTKSFQRAESLFQSLAIGIRGALAGIRSAVEVILDYPDMPPAKREEFHRIIHQKALTAGEATDRLTGEYAGTIHSPASLPRVRVRDLVEAVRKKAAEKLGVRLADDSVDDRIWIHAEPYLMTLALAFILARLAAETGGTSFRCESKVKKRFVGLDLTWDGPPLRMETVHLWEGQSVLVADETVNSTLGEILERHRAELWSQPSNSAGQSCMCLLLEAAEPAVRIYSRRQTILPTARPVYYDFDLFSQPGQSPELDDRLLTEITYTVFDTETTGLNPREGDEMVALGAVRIVNGRLLESECFDHLVKPEGVLRSESIRIHGIQPEMLKDQPDARQVLHLFHSFVEGTILVAHNAAFDMRLLQLQEARTGVRFGNPVLDTMILSAVVHPAHATHDLDAIAERLGVTIMGRHTALGDAMGTAEIFLRLMPLLDALGIRTFKQAREASQKTFYARLKY